MKMSYKCLFFFWFVGKICLHGTEYNIPSSIRFTLDRPTTESSLVYYFSQPDLINYPILILCEGSSSKESLNSVVFLRNFFLDRIEPLNVGYLTIEKWGIDGNHVNEEEFWTHYSRSQRLEDHLRVIAHLNQNPPIGWNGKLIFIGVSEGGPLVTDLATICPNTLATINWVGAGDWSWADELWQFFTKCSENPPGIPQTRLEYDALVQSIILNPIPDKELGGMTYLYHADAFLKPPVDYSKILTPFLIVKGADDSDIVSCDEFARKAQEAGALITYFRIDGMDHWLRKRPDVIDRSFLWLREQLKKNSE